ncbi:MAG: L-asparaginase 1, partial [Bacteroidales bacterium]
PVLADIGIHIRYNDSLIIRSPAENQFKIHTNLDTSVAILKIFPGITEEFIKSFLSIKNIKAIILETYGSGNAPTSEWFINALKETIQRDIIILNITQCQAGKVDMEAYSTGIRLKEIGVISGYDSTTEAALTKLFFLLGQENETQNVKIRLSENLRGEITIN